MARYVQTVAGIDERDLGGGFFEGWAAPPDAIEHLQILRNSARAVLAINDESNVVIGFVTALSDGVLSAYIPLLEVLPAHRGRGIGGELVRRLLLTLDGLYMIDVMCDDGIRPFYERLGFVRASGAAIRRYDWRTGGGAGAGVRG